MQIFRMCIFIAIKKKSQVQRLICGKSQLKSLDEKNHLAPVHTHEFLFQ